MQLQNESGYLTFLVSFIMSLSPSMEWFHSLEFDWKTFLFAILQSIVLGVISVHAKWLYRKFLIKWKGQSLKQQKEEEL